MYLVRDGERRLTRHGRDTARTQLLYYYYTYTVRRTSVRYCDARAGKAVVYIRALRPYTG